ncbi:hypothetical protein LINGRAHAP2_LOCUS30370 [Linum grandiflorum]
MKAKDLKVHAK